MYFNEGRSPSIYHLNYYLTKAPEGRNPKLLLWDNLLLRIMYTLYSVLNIGSR